MGPLPIAIPGGQAGTSEADTESKQPAELPQVREASVSSTEGSELRLGSLQTALACGLARRPLASPNIMSLSLCTVFTISRALSLHSMAQDTHY